jgi:cytochrome c-type biogenesis protein CcmF
VTGGKISVGAPFFELTFVPLMIPLLLAIPFGPMLAWKRGDLPGAAQRLGVAMLGSLAAVVLTYTLQGGRGVLAPLALGLGAWLILGSLAEIAERARLFRTGLVVSMSRLAGLPRSALGSALAHAGMGATVIGIVCATAYQSETIAALAPGQTMEVGGYTLLYQGNAPGAGPNYREERALIIASRGGAEPFPLAPTKRFYEARQTATTEAAIETTGFSQLYVSLGDETGAGTVTIRASYKPMVTLIWLGALVMSLGGALSISDRRLRIGAPRRAAPVRSEPAAA